MAKRRLTDVLREEAQKGPEGPVEIVNIIEVTAEPIVEDAPLEAATPDRTPELTAALAQVKQDLEAALHRESTLKKQVDDLQASLKEQKQQLQHLQTDLKQAHKAAAELEQTKQVILQLTDVNTQLSQDKDQLSQENMQLAQELADLKQPKAQPSAIQRRPPQPDNRYYRPGLKPLPQHSLHPHTQNERSNKLDLGWAD